MPFNQSTPTGEVMYRIGFFFDQGYMEGGGNVGGTAYYDKNGGKTIAEVDAKVQEVFEALSAIDGIVVEVPQRWSGTQYAQGFEVSP